MDDEIILRTGRRLLANRGIIGISATEPEQLFDGYDGHLDTEPDGPLTAEERHELAERMIALWRAWGAAADAPLRSGGPR